MFESDVNNLAGWLVVGAAACPRPSPQHQPPHFLHDEQDRRCGTRVGARHDPYRVLGRATDHATVRIWLAPLSRPRTGQNKVD